MDDLPKRPHLTLVDPDKPSDHECEFAPLPGYCWDERPPTYELTQDEAATAIHLAEGHLPRAAALLKVPVVRLNRLFRASPRLQRVFEESAGLVVAKAFSQYIEALEEPDARRREWGATKIMQSRAAMGHLFSPAPAANIQSSITTNSAQREIVFRWKAPDGHIVDQDATDDH